MEPASQENNYNDSFGRHSLIEARATPLMSVKQEDETRVLVFSHESSTREYVSKLIGVVSPVNQWGYSRAIVRRRPRVSQA